jgi:hypothetical protein
LLAAGYSEVLAGRRQALLERVVAESGAGFMFLSADGCNQQSNRSAT